MELFQELKDLMIEWEKTACSSDWDSCNELKQKASVLKRELKSLWCDSPTGLIKCPACHGEGSFGDNWNEKMQDCRYCFRLGFVDLKTQMAFVRSYRGVDPDLRAIMCLDREIG